MNLKHSTLIATVAAFTLATSISVALFAQESTTAQKVDVKTPAPAADEKAKALEAQLESELNKPSDSVIPPAAAPTPTNAETTPAAEPVATLPPEDPLITQYKLRKNKNFKAVEFELAKELALNRGSTSLEEQEKALSSAALAGLSAAVGSISEPQKEETYFEYQEDYETGEFVVVLVKDSYVKAARGDLCQIGTQVHLRTSIQAEFTAKLAELTPATTATTTAPAAPSSDVATTTDAAAATPAAPTAITEIECYNDERPTYSQRVVN